MFDAKTFCAGYSKNRLKSFKFQVTLWFCRFELDESRKNLEENIVKLFSHSFVTGLLFSVLLPAALDRRET